PEDAGRHRETPARRRPDDALCRGRRFRHAGDRVPGLHLLVHRDSRQLRTSRRGHGAVRARPGAAQPCRHPFRRRGAGNRGAVGQFPADLFDGGHHPLRQEVEPHLGGGLMARVVIVSNRVPARAKREQQAGGLAVVLEEALKGEVLWLGWSGKRSASTSSKPYFATRGSITFATIDLSEEDYRDYYAGFSNRSLWPLFHYRTGLVTYSREEYKGYRATNRKFAEALAPFLKPGDAVWVHDYHLIPLGRWLRWQGIEVPIVFILPIPFPPQPVLDILPPAGELAADLAVYDVI